MQVRFYSVFVLLGFTLSCSQVPTKPNETSLLEAIDTFNQAFAKADTTTLSKMLTKNYMHTNSASGPWKKPGWLSYVAGQRQKLDQGILTITEYSMSEMEYHLYDNTAVLSAVVKNIGKEDTLSFSKSFKVTHLWVYEDGTWKRAAFHDGKIE